MNNNKKVLAINGHPIKVDNQYVTIADTNLQDKVITPTAEPQVIMADEEYIGLNSVMIMSDDNLVPENIKEGASIFGVTGTYKATDVAFAIADGNAAPDTPAENMMWVQTDTEVSTFSIRSSIEKPTNPTEGMVWVVNGQTSSGAFDILADENSLIVYPQKAYQYINGEWTARPIKIYKDGAWADLFTTTLNITYPEGTICECTDGVITYTAPDKTGIWELIVPNPGTWLTSCSGGNGGLIEPISTQVTNNEEIIDVNIVYFTATLEVTYPRGTCTAILGSQIYTHSGGGTASFVVNNKGTYNIEIVYNSLNKAETAIIDTYGSIITKSLDYSKYIFNNGDVSTLTGGWAGYLTESRGSWSVNETRIYFAASTAYGGSPSLYKTRCYTQKQIDLTDYTTLCCTVSSCSGSAAYLCVGSSTTSYDKSIALSGTGTFTLDISNLNKNAYIVFYAHSNSSATVTKVWLA